MNAKLGFWSKLLNRNEIFDKAATYTPVAGKESGPTVREEPASINLVRAVYDEADKVVKSINRELAALEVRKTQLILSRDAHIELLDVAKKHVNLQRGETK